MGATQRQIARTFNSSQTTISKLIIRHQQTGQTQDRQRSGRPRVTIATSERRPLHPADSPPKQMCDGDVNGGKGTMAEFEFFDEGKAMAPNCIREVHPFGGGGVMEWGGICGQITTRLVIIRGNLNAQRYRDEVSAETTCTASSEPTGT
ncbi:uncharacterized protein [Haliotis cracherodii]|uniref:uncharacterized protein n=1 Tax=Haliotis cracherodii TaxID=6455 RepID=UPI0039E87731